MKKETDINIDALLRDTFLTVVELRQGTTVRHGMELYRHCQRQVELVRERLKDLPFNTDNLRLHCVPVINLFPLEADPLHLSPLENEFLLRPMRIQDGHTEIYSVDNIISSRHTGSQAYVPFSSFRHRGGMLRHDAPERYYHTRVKRGPSGLHDTWLILGGDAFDTDRMLEDETLSLSLTGTNGQLPRKALQSTLLDTPVHASQNVLRVRNLCAPTQPC